MTVGYNGTLIRIVAILLLTLFGSGCELFQVEFDIDNEPLPISSSDKVSGQRINYLPAAIVSPTSGSDAVITLLRYSRFISEMSEADLNKEFDKIDATNNVEYSNRGLLKMVVLLSLPKSEFYDERRAEGILNDFINDGKNNTPALTEYAHLLLSNLKLREDHWKLYDDLHQKLTNERAQRKKLQQKLDELKSIEKSITKRQKEAGG
ncbi:MAG: hypothetical protein ACC707_01545 [Thiohalomonadales bacterium]